MVSMKRIILSLLLAAGLIGCSPTMPAWPTADSSAVDQAVQTQMADQKPAPTNTAIPEQATAPIPSSSPQVPVNLTPSAGIGLAGLVFGGGDLRQIQTDGTEKLLYERPVDVVSPDLQIALTNSNADYWMYTLATRNLQRLTMTETRTECCAVWWTNHPNKILFLSNILGGNSGLSTQGYLTMVKQDGTGYLVLDSDHPSTGEPAPSPDGTWIAYGFGDTGWLFGGEQDPQKIDPVDYGLASLKGQTISNPAWSPDGKKLAWAWQSNLNSGSKAGILILDMEKKSYQLGKLFLIDGLVFYPQIRWSPDGAWLAYYIEPKDANVSGTYVMRTDGSMDSDIRISGKSVAPGAWSPDGKWLALIGDVEAPSVGIYLAHTGDWQLTYMGFGQSMPHKIFGWW
jgi:Tol biopolymer transport system component